MFGSTTQRCHLYKIFDLKYEHKAEASKFKLSLNHASSTASDSSPDKIKYQSNLACLRKRKKQSQTFPIT
jgi:hypothetical protein